MLICLKQKIIYRIWDNMKINKFILFALLISSCFLDAGIFKYFELPKSEQLIISGGIPERQHQLTVLKKEKENLESAEKEFNAAIQEELNKVNSRISQIKDSLKAASAAEQEFLNKTLAVLNEISQRLIDTQLLRTRLVAIVDQHIDILQNYLKDPSLKALKVEEQASFSYEMLHQSNKDIVSQQEELARLNEEKNVVESELENRKKDLQALEKEIKAKEKEQKEYTEKTDLDEVIGKLDLRQNGELLDLQLQLLNTRKRYIDLKIKEIANQLALLNTKVLIGDSKLKVLKDNLELIESRLRVTKEDVESSEKKLADKKTESAELRSEYSQEIRRLLNEKEKLKQEYESLLKKYDIRLTEARALNEWNVDTKNWTEAVSIYELGFINDQILEIDRKIALKEAQRDLEQEKLKAEENLVKAITSWYKVSQRKIKTQEDINKEKALYEAYKAEANRELASNKDAISTSTSLLSNQAKALNNLREKIKSLESEQEKISSRYGKDAYRKALDQLKKSEELINNQIDLTNRLIEAYSVMNAVINESLKQINNVLKKLESIGGVLLRSELAISWVNIKNIIPDLRLFVSDLKNIFSSYIYQFTPNNIQEKIVSYVKAPESLLWLVIYLIIIILGYFILRNLLPFLYNALKDIKSSIPGLQFTCYLLAVILGFVFNYLLGIYIWSIIFALIKLDVITDLAPKVLFYLASIPYLCYLSNKFIDFLINFNKEHNNVLLSAAFQKRFTEVFIFFAYSTVIIFFFREAFISTTYGQSDLPTILLALYSIIFRISLILLIGKEEILSIIPTRNKFWLWLRDFIDSYYYLLLVGIIFLMIISDPYIGGFSRLVSFVFWRVVWTIILVVILWWLQAVIRRSSSKIFFKVEDDSTKERFSHAKTFYGAFMVFAFIASIILGIVLVAEIWGRTMPLQKFTEALNLTLFSVQGEGDQYIPITPQSFITIITFFLVGFAIAWAFERFILRRIFNLLIVDKGVQNTISSISTYLIVLVILLVGLLRVGLGGLIPFLIGALAVGIAFAIKGPANDVISYFILLVERSVKIGDFIKIDDETVGVVRKISPRAIVLRRKNSVSIIVPNSKVTNSSFYNWNYTRGFIAFDDIMLTIPFSAEPKLVREILFKVLDNNSNVLKSPSPIIRLDGFSDLGYTFRVRGFLSSVNVLNQWDIASDIRFAIVEELKKNNIQLAYPRRAIIYSKEDDKDIFKIS